MTIASALFSPTDKCYCVFEMRGELQCMWLDPRDIGGALSPLRTLLATTDASTTKSSFDDDYDVRSMLMLVSAACSEARLESTGAERSCLAHLLCCNSSRGTGYEGCIKLDPNKRHIYRAHRVSNP